MPLFCARTSFLLALLLLVLACQARAQQIRVSGKVVQADKKTPVPGAGILSLRTQAATIANTAGDFKIYVQPNDSLLIRAVGFKVLHYAVKPQQGPELRLTVILEEDSVQLQEVRINSLPSEDAIKRALRNMPEKPKMLVQRPGYVPGSEPPPPPPPPPPNMILNPVSYFSREGKQKRKLRKLVQAENVHLKQSEATRAKAAQEEADRKYNSFFKDSTNTQ